MIRNMLVSGILSVCFFAFSFPLTSYAEQSTHNVQKGESLYSIATDYGISYKQLQAMNNKSNVTIQPGESLQLPVLPSSAEKDLLARLVEAEAKGESYAGKVAVATVVLNRVESSKFPDTLYGVIHDGKQFSPVLNGTIHQPAGEESKKAVQEAVYYQGYDQESLFFYNPDKAQSDYLEDKEVTTVIGNHLFLR
ncbi:cell wall hydrolase [Pontibacillus salicampi]|uniref:Cell wall hydrolase n=1 Tax=Pontibacillus salicampi TaxID=1449801 RepID=A0ABV6LM14_9BACI